VTASRWRRLWLRTRLRHLVVVRFGYWLRPYDGLADARRWRWQRSHPCQHGDGLAAVLQRWARGAR
jgi:hypothetical protein